MPVTRVDITVCRRSPRVAPSAPSGDIGGADQMLYFAGAALPFAKTRAERAKVLAAAGYLLDEDIDTSLAYATRFWEAWSAD